MFQKILVGTDGSDSANAAVEHAVELAKAGGADVLVVHSYPLPRTDAGSPFGPTDAYAGPEIGKSVLADVEKRFGGEAKITTVLRGGDPADVIVDVAEEEKVDLIIVGNKGMTSAKRFLLGSVPNDVSHHAPCSVLIVHTT